MKTNDNNIAEVRLKYSSRVSASDRPQVRCSTHALELFRETWDKETIELYEECKLMLLNRANKVLGIAQISQGGISGTVTDVRIILQYALKANASGIILCHNHPSGNEQPSEADLKISSKLKEAAMIHDITLLDHLIITNDGYYSMADMGYV
ncbi:MAG: JAB domain-containing protein [Bacteroidales bacterium]